MAVAALPAGSDPADIAMSEPQVLKEAAENAKSFLSFRVERALSSGEIKTAEGRARAAEAALAMVAEHPNELVRDQFLVTVSDRTRQDAERLRPHLESLVRAFAAQKDQPKPPAGRQAGQGPPKGAEEAPAWEPDDEASFEPPPGPGPGPGVRRGPSAPGERAGREALVLAVHEPEAMAGRLHEVLFADPLQRAALRALLASASLHEAVENADDEVAQLLRRLAVTEPDADPDHIVIALARAAAQVALREVEAEARQAEAEGDSPRLAAAASATAWLKSELEIMQEPGASERTLGGRK